jgi:hypothetical protein
MAILGTVGKLSHDAATPRFLSRPGWTNGNMLSQICFMPDDLEVQDTPAGITQAFFFALGGIFLAKGIDLLLGGNLLTGALCLGVGAFLFYAPWAWKRLGIPAKVVDEINEIARAPKWWLLILFLWMQFMVFSPYIDQRSWPISVNRTGIAALSDDASRWKIAQHLRSLSKPYTGGTCDAAIFHQPSSGTAADGLNEILEAAGWKHHQALPVSEITSAGITIKAVENGLLYACAGALSKALSNARIESTVEKID